MTFKLKYLHLKTKKKLRDLVKADELAQSMIDFVSEKLPTTEGVSEVSEPRAFWKFALYASYVQGCILCDAFEFKIPKTTHEGFATSCLKTLQDHFYPESSKEDNPIANKIIKDSYYSFKHRLHWAKMRRAGNFLPEAEDALASLLHDQVKSFDGIYDLKSFETENPTVETIA